MGELRNKFRQFVECLHAEFDRAETNHRSPPLGRWVQLPQRDYSLLVLLLIERNGDKEPAGVVIDVRAVVKGYAVEW